MDKLYSKQSLIIKAVCCFLLAPLYALLSSLIIVENSFIYILASVVPICSLFTVPFWLSLMFIKKYRVAKIVVFIAYDFAVCVLPAMFGVLFYEIIFSIINGKSVADGFVTLIFTAIFIIIAILFWFLYYLFSYKK